MKKICVLLFVSLLGCSSVSSKDGFVQIVNAFPELEFERAVDMQEAPGGSNMLWVLEQAGKIYRFKNDPKVEEKELVLDISDEVNDEKNEMGLLGLAFHPDFKNNGLFYLNYTVVNPRRTLIVSYKWVNGKVDLSSKQQLMEFEQPYANHNGGQLQFGPDGYLYIAVGDGGSGGDPKGHGQNRSTLLGSILRINVDKQDPRLFYSIPEDNPFYGNDKGWRDEIYAYGLRNPWRFCFNPKDNSLWAADVGQHAIEEINIIEKGGNYGWNIMEGSDCFEKTPDCDKSKYIHPIHQYRHGIGMSITGGYFYTSNAVQKLKDAYLYADYVTGRVWALFYEDGKVKENKLITDDLRYISSFGKDSSGKVYILCFDDNIYTFK